MSIVLLHSSPNGQTNDQGGGGRPHPPPLSRSHFFLSFFFLFAMLMRDELACMYCIPPPLPPPVRPSVRVATARSGLESDLAFPRHLFTSGGAHSRRRIKWPTRPAGGPWTYSLPNDMYKKKEKKEIWVSLSRRAQIPHSTRTKVHGSAPLHHTTNLHYTTCYTLATTATKMPYVSNPGCFVFSCSAVLLPETYVPYLPSNLFKSSSSTYHAMPPCKEEGKTTPSSPAGSYVPY